METTDKNKENRLRKQLMRNGYKLHKSRVKKINLDNLGGYMITEIKRNLVVGGSKYELDLKDVEKFLYKLQPPIIKRLVRLRKDVETMKRRV